MNNDSALDFYKSHGFEVVETKEQYYKRIEPADAHVLEKKVERRKKASVAARRAFGRGGDVGIPGPSLRQGIGGEGAEAPQR